jgi:hypothetical protein
MFSRIRKRFTYTNAIMTLALVFAMTGGAYAAGKYLITSTKQIKPSVLKQLQGKAGKAGPEGKAGAPGAPGKDGVAGKDGVNGVNGKDGVSVVSSPESAGANCKAGGSKFVAASGATYACNGENGKNGTTGFTETLPSGKTETGSYSFNAASEQAALASISYNIPLPEPLAAGSVHYVKTVAWKGGTGPAACPGTGAAPSALKGNLCVYEGGGSGELAEIKTPSLGSAGSDTSGATLLFIPTSANPISGFGTWAVTAS